jgi:hypothetical protein
MTKEHANYIRDSFAGFNNQLMSELGRHPGAEIDDVDIELIRQLMNKLKRRKLELAHYESGMVWGKGRPIWINGAGNIIAWIRNQQFRPKVSQIEAEMARLDMIAESVIVEGSVAETRRQISAPAEYSVRALAASSANDLLGMPVAPTPAKMPEWIDDFPSRGNPDEDRIIVNCLLHMSEAKARETIDRIVADRFAETRRRTEADQQRETAQRARQVRLDGADGASAVIAEINRRRHNAMQEA